MSKNGRLMHLSIFASFIQQALLSEGLSDLRAARHE
jgi:hypothetical protein